MTQPTSVPADGSLKAVWVPVLADPTNPTAAECNAGGALDASCYLTDTGFTPNTDEQAIVDNRLCSRQTFEQPGRYTDSLELGYVHNPASPGDNQAYTTFAYRTAGYIVTRWGLDFEDDIAAGDIVDVYPVKCGIQRKSPPEANSVLKVMQKMFVTGTVRRDVVVS
ncbi:hypothetical protein ABZS66_19245 [Dactylosporangium sp. NPDC005572]|uniref:phage tail tube protein n=1 Tax=Dactylosporangium sp. NPDC005572 TaxID=3156889 RepID=UPI0033B6B431